ncbi:MAG: serine kinase [Chloroflexi bacterium]|nr:serine kinase [Chloroflexota bacterium]
MPRRSADGETVHIQPGGQEAYCSWEHAGRFVVRSGREIVIDPAPDAEDAVILLAVLGTCLALLLHQRGLLVLHGSGVIIADRAVMFLGAKGAGKSTMAAALYAAGCPFLADDIIAIDPRVGSAPQVFPGFPLVKLWPDAAEASLRLDPIQLPYLAPGYDKRACSVAMPPGWQSFPLGGIYALADGPEPRLIPLSPREAVVELIRHSYAARFGQNLLSGAGAARHLEQCTRVVHAAPVYRCERPRLLPTLPLAAAHIIQSCQSLVLC